MPSKRQVAPQRPTREQHRTGERHLRHKKTQPKKTQPKAFNKQNRKLSATAAGSASASRQRSNKRRKSSETNLEVKRSADIEERARILNDDESQQDEDKMVVKPKPKKLYCLSFVLNTLVLLLAGPLFLTLFCNDACEYNSPNIVCPAVNTTDPSKSYVCLNDADECQCADSTLKGDNRCDPFNNNCGCDWDGGDCCTHDFDTTFCSLDQSLCQCLDPWAVKVCTLGSCNEVTVGDGECDGHNNNCNCNWDGGDCCAADYNCSKNCNIVVQNVYNITIESFSTCDFIGTEHLGGSSYCEELESTFGCDCSGCACGAQSVGTGCSGEGCHCKDPSSPAFFAHNDAETYATYMPENYEPPIRPPNATQTWKLEDVCDYIDFEVSCLFETYS